MSQYKVASNNSLNSEAHLLDTAKDIHNTRKSSINSQLDIPSSQPGEKAYLTANASQGKKMIKKNKAVSVSMTETANTFASITHSKWSTVNAHSLSAVRGTDAAAEGFVLLPEEPIHMGVPTSTLAPAICNGSSGPPDMDHFAHPQNLTNEMIMKALDMTRAPSWRGHENAPSQRATAITKTQPPSSMLRKEVGTHTTSPKSHKTGNKVTDSKPFNMSEPKKKQFPLTKIDKRADEEEAEEDLVRKWQGTSARYPKAWLQSIPSVGLFYLFAPP
jgi:hypothetical protein